MIQNILLPKFQENYNQSLQEVQENDIDTAQFYEGLKHTFIDQNVVLRGVTAAYNSYAKPMDKYVTGPLLKDVVSIAEEAYNIGRQVVNTTSKGIKETTDRVRDYFINQAKN